MKASPMQVTLVDHMGSDLSVVNAARVSFDKESEWVDEDFYPTGMESYPATRKVLKDADAKLINYLAKHNHWSPFAHTSIQLRVRAPIFVARQLVKHQVGGVWNEVSRRYVDSEPEFYFPEVWRGRPVNAKQGSSGVVEPLASSSVMGGMWLPTDVVALMLDQYLNLLQQGVAPEQARMILPQNMQTEWYWTGSLMFFCRVCRERLAPGAQQETREVAEQIAEVVAPLYPVAWSALMESK
jgi:thymidylate synthase (FAD)